MHSYPFYYLLFLLLGDKSKWPSSKFRNKRRFFPPQAKEQSLTNPNPNPINDNLQQRNRGGRFPSSSFTIQQKSLFAVLA